MSYYKIQEQNGDRRVYHVPSSEAVCPEYVKSHCVEVAQKWRGVWMIGGTCVIRDARYREILEATPELPGAENVRSVPFAMTQEDLNEVTK